MSSSSPPPTPAEAAGSIETKLPVWFWIIGVVALLWNLMGAAAFFADPGVTPSMMEPMLETLEEDQRESFKQLYETRPMWVLIAFGVAVFGGVLGCIALLARKKIAIFIFLLSLIGVVLQNSWVFFKTDILNITGMGTVVLPALVFLVGAGLVLYSLKMAKRGWLT